MSNFLVSNMGQFSGRSSKFSSFSQEKKVCTTAFHYWGQCKFILMPIHNNRSVFSHFWRLWSPKIKKFYTLNYLFKGRSSKFSSFSQIQEVCTTEFHYRGQYKCALMPGGYNRSGFSHFWRLWSQKTVKFYTWNYPFKGRSLRFSSFSEE